MSDSKANIIGQIYNGFLLRDFLGYVIPGSIVLLCMVHFVSIISNIALLDILKKIPEKGVFYLLIMGLSYACGHCLSGIFFHLIEFNWFFSYTPNDLLTDYPQQKWQDAWARHRSTYREACSNVGDSLQDQIERHAALLHFTGHFSAAILFAFVYILLISIVDKNINLSLYNIPLIILFVGLYRHYRIILSLRYKQEKEVIRLSEQNMIKNINE